MGTPMAPGSSTGEAVPDLTVRRPEVVQRLLARGVPPRALEALLPGWELLITEAGAPRLATPQEGATA